MIGHSRSPQPKHRIAARASVTIHLKGVTASMVDALRRDVSGCGMQFSDDLAHVTLTVGGLGAGLTIDAAEERFRGALKKQRRKA